jgi:hypothetical protein
MSASPSRRHARTAPTTTPPKLIVTLACPHCGGRIELDPELGYICLDHCTTFTVTIAAHSTLRKGLAAKAAG